MVSGKVGIAGAVTVLGHQWSWVPRASPEPTRLAMHIHTTRPVTTLLGGRKASTLEASLTSIELSESNA